MSSSDASQREMTRLVRSALAHLYDHAFLQSHPLALMLDAQGSLDLIARAQNVRRILLDCIETLRPQGGGEGPWQAARTHAIMTYRYVDGLGMPRIADKLAISRRQAYREHGKGVRTVASLVWEKARRKGEGNSDPTAHPSAPSDRLRAAQAEVARLHQAVRTESLQPRDVLAGILQLLRPVCRETGFRIDVRPGEDWPTVTADRVMLRQALLNLLSHLLHQVRGDLSIHGRAEAGRFYLDIGEGPPRSSLQPPASGAGKREPSLEVAQGLIAAQGGRLEIDQHDQRWHLLVVLPTTLAVTILVIDDNADLVALLQRYVRGHAISVVGATEGPQALRLAAELRPQLITLDVMMPGLDGWDILQQLQSSPTTKDIPIIICSVLNEPEMARAMGASDYITKPVDQDDLLAVLRRWLGVLRPAS